MAHVTETPVPVESHIERYRRLIEEQYLANPTGGGGSFGEILCHEIHTKGLTFIWLAQKWGISLPDLGELIWDHCKRLQEDPVVIFTEAEELGQPDATD